METLEHTRSCAALNPHRDCTCCLEERRHTQTAETMSAAWRKRAEEAEAICQLSSALILEYLNDIPGASSRGIADCHAKIMSAIVYSKLPCPSCGARCQIWIKAMREFRWCHYCNWKES